MGTLRLSCGHVSIARASHDRLSFPSQAHPYSVSFAVVFFGYHILLAMPGDDFIANGRRGLGFAVLVYLIICSWQLRDSLLVRPHPVFWRLIKGLAFLYLFSLVWLSFQTVDDARHLLSYWDPALGVPLEDQSYAVACDIFTPDDPVSQYRNIYDAFFNENGRWIFMDVFVVSHVLGWLVKMIMLRDVRLTLMASVLFELYEVTFKHMLANFAECWWDSIVLDVIVCNGAGIVLGYFYLRLFRCKMYNFLGSVDVVNAEGHKVRRWKPLVSFRYLVGPLLVLACLALIELNAFFLKFILWLPAPHHLNLSRIVFWGFVGMAGTRELYHKMENPSAPFGMMIALIFLLSTLEAVICYKMSTGLFKETMPVAIKTAWIVVFAALFLFSALYYPIQHHKNSDNKQVVYPSAAEGAAAIKPKLA